MTCWAMMTALKLSGMRAAYDDILAEAIKRRHPVQKIIAALLQAEIADKTARSNPANRPTTSVTAASRASASGSCPRGLIRRVAVGTLVAQRPPHGSGRAR